VRLVLVVLDFLPFSHLYFSSRISRLAFWHSNNGDVSCRLHPSHCRLVVLFLISLLLPRLAISPPEFVSSNTFQKLTTFADHLIFLCNIHVVVV